MACTIDFRSLDEGFGGKTYKRKREESAAARTLTERENEGLMEVEEIQPPPAKRSAIPSSENPNKPSFGAPTYDGVIAGKVSGRKWKQARKERASARRRVGVKGKGYEEREREKEVKRAFKERIGELKEEIRRNKEEKRKVREEREKRKKENILRSGTKLQKISNPNTLKKIAKSKDRKLLRVVPDDFVSNNKDNKNAISTKQKNKNKKNK